MATQRMTQTQLVRGLAEAGEVTNKQSRAILDTLSSLAISEGQEERGLRAAGYRQARSRGSEGSIGPQSRDRRDDQDSGQEGG